MKKRARMRYPKPLSDIYQEALAGLGLESRLRESEIWRLWREVVGSAIAQQAQPVRIIDGVLTVAVSSGPWMQELTFLKGMLKEKINSRLGSDVVRDIVLKSGRIAGTPDSLPDRGPRKKVLTDREQALIAEQTAAIEDEEIREALGALMKASLECRR